MGGCCCCSSKGNQLNSEPGYYYYPRVAEEHLRLSPQHGPASALSVSLLVDLGLDTSTPDHYRPPPAPIPYDVALRPPHAHQLAHENCADKNDRVQASESDSVQETFTGNSEEKLDKCAKLIESDCNLKTGLEIELGKESEIELSKSVESIVISIEEEDVCPICLEEYDAENPKLCTKCEHHYHLACILEWMERSDICPVCDQEMIFSPPTQV